MSLDRESDAQGAHDGGEQRELRLEKLQALRSEGIDPFLVERFSRSHAASDLSSPASPIWALSEEAQRALTMRLAGRLVAHRPKGKVTFADLQDETGRVQIYARRDDLGEELFARFNDLDVGDILGVEGFPFHTRTGEPTAHVQSYQLLAKALRPPPLGKVDAEGRTHGALADREDRYRYRYLDLMANPESRSILERRIRMISAIRSFLEGRGFLEVETPVLQLVAGGASARPFTTHHNALDHEFKLRISLELYLKRLIVGGFEKVFEIGRVFRNEGLSTRHSPEFTLLELYQAYASLEDMMDLVEGLYEFVSQEVNGATEYIVGADRRLLPFHEGEPSPVAQVEGGIYSPDVNPVDFARRPWRRLPMLEGIHRYAGIAPEELRDLETAKTACRRIGVPFELDQEHLLGGLIDKLHERYTQPNLIHPTFITDFPVEISPLAKRRQDDPSLARRFEVYVAAQELGNAFSEINDPLDQRARFEQQAGERLKGDEEAHPMDEDYVLALEYGMPPTGGLGIGMDRMAQVLTGAESIRDVILFPLLRPQA